MNVPVEGTPYVLSATAYPDEFTEPVKFMQEGAALFALRTRNIVIGILGGTLILIGFIVALYAYRLTAKIKYLTEITDRISVGDLDAEITGIKSRDEIGELANAIGRMQESIRLAIKRLRERK
jgi:HAMP domain-containing protein